MGLYNIDCLEESFFDQKVPENMKITDKDIMSPSRFKSKSKALLLWAEKNGYSEKKISGIVKGWYYANIGTIITNMDMNYIPRMNFIGTLVDDYCIDKDKNIIKRDLEKTIEAIDKLEAKGTDKNIEFKIKYREDAKKALHQIK